MARRKPFDEYRRTTKQERIIERKKLVSMQATPRFDQWLVWMFRMQHSECFYCDVKIDILIRKSYHIEHRIPIYYGGKSEYKNLCLACPSCNYTKGTQQLIRDKEHLRIMNQRRSNKGHPSVLYM